MNLYDHPVHADAPERVHFVLETPKGDTRKFKLDQETNSFTPTPRYHHPIPFHYGFIPGTILDSDDSQLDAILVDNTEIEPGQEIEVTPVGVIERVDHDHKLLVTRDAARLTVEELSEFTKLATDHFNMVPEKRVTAILGQQGAQVLIRICIDEWKRRNAS